MVLETPDMLLVTCCTCDNREHKEWKETKDEASNQDARCNDGFTSFVLLPVRPSCHVHFRSEELETLKTSQVSYTTVLSAQCGCVR